MKETPKTLTCTCRKAGISCDREAQVAWKVGSLVPKEPGSALGG